MPITTFRSHGNALNFDIATGVITARTLISGQQASVLIPNIRRQPKEVYCFHSETIPGQAPEYSFSQAVGLNDHPVPMDQFSTNIDYRDTTSYFSELHAFYSYSEISSNVNVVIENPLSGFNIDITDFNIHVVY